MAQLNSCGLNTFSFRFSWSAASVFNQLATQPVPRASRALQPANFRFLAVGHPRRHSRARVGGKVSIIDGSSITRAPELTLIFSIWCSRHLGQGPHRRCGGIPMPRLERRRVVRARMARTPRPPLASIVSTARTTVSY
jgi:hypothetical protein